MNRSLTNVIFGGYGTAPTKGKVESCDVETHKCHQEIDANSERRAARGGLWGFHGYLPSPRPPSSPALCLFSFSSLAAASEMLRDADRVIIVPGYGMAVANAQHTISALATLLKDKGCEVQCSTEGSTWKYRHGRGTGRGIAEALQRGMGTSKVREAAQCTRR